jgi:hypothetical protein
VAHAVHRDSVMPDVKIRFRSIERTPPVEAAIQRWAARLDEECESLRGCSVIVEHPLIGIRRSKFAVRVAVVLDAKEVALEELTATHHDVYVAVADAFRATLQCVRDHELARFDPLA